MGAAAVPIFVAATAVSVGASVLGGMQANKAAKQEAANLEAQGRLIQEEKAREAARHAEDVRKFHRNQSLAFIKNGVTLAGSPLLVLDETMKEGQEEVNSISKQGDAEATLYNQRAAQTRNSGRAALIGGIGQAAGSAASGYAVGREAGIFKS